MRTPASNRGSALLIVLGLLSFLMISAVAFAISMRTERAAASAYRRSLQARELIGTAFADAYATANFALNEQRANAGFNVSDEDTYTVEALAPFKYSSGEDSYGRLIASRTEQNDSSIAFLLDDAVMRHIPPYIAYAVYETLEVDECPNGNGKDVSGSPSYTIDRAANWKPIKTQIPKSHVQNNQVDTEVNETTVGRMAWAVINLSDALDINAIGSVSQRRGIGLTGSELAFGQLAGTTQSSGDPRDFYDLLPSTADAEATELPLFASGADLSVYAARVKTDSLLNRDVNGIYPFSWENALSEEGLGAFSPFTVYSFWPNVRRRNESGARRSTTGTGTGTQIVISCDEIDETYLTPSCEFERLVQSTLNSSGTEGTSLARLLLDYIDTNNKPDLYETAFTQDLYNNALPTVECVPMVSEIAYDNTGWDNGGDFIKDLKAQIEEKFAGIEPDTNEFETYNTIPTTLKTTKKLALNLPDPELNIGLRAYFPGRAESEGNFTFEPEGFVSVFASALKGGSVLSECFAANQNKNVDISLSGGSLSVAGGGDDLVFESANNIRLAGQNMNFDINVENIPIAVPAQGAGASTQITEVTFNFLVDFVFRVTVKDGSTIVDLCPADRGRTSKRDKSNYPTDIANRFDQNQMGANDAQFFRVTRPVSVTFALEWEVEEKEVTEGETTKTVYSVKSKIASGHDITVTCRPTEQLQLDGGTLDVMSSTQASCLAASPEAGAWYTVDPRYNWLSPMLGLTGGSGGYGTSNHKANLSSPHWLFIENGQITGGNEDPSQVQKDYASANSSLVPFSWGLEVQDIRYGYNDAGQLLLPGEIGFLPVPFPDDVWTPNERAYLTNSLENYYNTVAKASFFRTIPITDFNDGAFSGTSAYGGYDRAVALTEMLEGFGGSNFPEEHRGIVNVFSGMDDYYTSMRLRQFAMMGVPGSIKQAAKVTLDRLKMATKSKRVPAALVSEDLKSLENDAIKNAELDTEAKYDTFVRDYLFPVPTDTPDAATSTWEQTYEIFPGTEAKPERPKRRKEAIIQSTSGNASFAQRLQKYNQDHTSDIMGQNDMTTLVAIGNETFGDRQQLFLYVLRADAIAYNSGRVLSQHKPLSTARAVVLLWRDAYGELPDRIIYQQFLP